jgi:hypothetical protein
VNYSQYCKEVVKDKADRKEAVKSFKLVTDMYAREEMEKLTKLTVSKMELRPDIRFSRQAVECGLRGSTLMMFPTVFHFVAVLQRSKRTFGILFRSFGADHEKVQNEWNAFCEMRHPCYSHLLQGIGPLDGSIAGIPDRRIHGIHTLYRDSQGPVLILDTFTNGPQDDPWDAWAKRKPKAKTDTRAGREYIKRTLKSETVENYSNVQKWMRAHLTKQVTAAIKDDWAWWTWNDEDPRAAKLMTLIGGKEETKQIFFDDNIEHTNARIVDCRAADNMPLPSTQTLNKLLVKVNPVEALLDEEYFLKKLQQCTKEHLDVGASLIEFQNQLTELEEQKDAYAKQVQALKMQLNNLTEENRRMKLIRKINIRDEPQLRDMISKEYDLIQFAPPQYRTVSDLAKEIDQGHCWLEHDEQGKLVRVMEMLFLKIKYKDLLLVESYEQDSDGKIQTRNYLPGVRKNVKDLSFKPAIDSFFQNGLEHNLKNCIKDDMLPIFVPDAPHQQTGMTQAYPLPCKLQQSQATFIIAEKEVDTHKELLSKIGLPGGKHFLTTEKDAHGGKVTRFWRWDKVATFEAATANLKRGAGMAGHSVDMAKTVDRLFREHPRREVYETLLLQMFETFTAKKLCGGFSGSVVVRVQPYEQDGRPAEPCIVKLDHGDAIKEEYINSKKVVDALPDRACRIIGDAVYVKGRDEEEYGAFKLELAGACWNVPELAQGAGNLLSTLKDLLLYESEQILLGSAASASDARPFGNVNSVIAETFGPGGAVSSLRKGGNGLRRSTTPLLWGWYTLRGKTTKFNPLTTKRGEYPPEPAMRALYRKYFNADMPDLKNLVVERIKPQLEELSKKSQARQELCPLIALAHGDLNAANIMIDALDAVWLIDFVTSVELPLFTDMCKFEMSCLFEYASIPITPKLLVEFASDNEEMWSSMNVGDWLRVDQRIAVLLLQELVSLPQDKLEGLREQDLAKLIEDVASKSGEKPHKQLAAIRQLKARLVANEALMDRAFSYCAEISKAILPPGFYLGDSLDIKGVDPPDGPGANGAASLRFFMEIVLTVRHFMMQDIMGVIREQSLSEAGLQPCDPLSLQMWLPLLRESYRIIGYRDISPQQKIWSIYHCNIVAGHVLRCLDMLKSNWSGLHSISVMQDLKSALAARKQATRLSIGRDEDDDKIVSEAESHWLYMRKEQLPFPTVEDRMVRRVHSICQVYKEKAGYYAPIWEVFVDGADKAFQDLLISAGSSCQSLATLDL